MQIQRELKIIPKEIDSETKLGRFFSMKDLLFALGCVFVSYNFIELVYPAYRMYYTGYVMIIAVICLIPSFKANEGKKLYQTIYYLLIKRRITYHSIDLEIHKEEGADEEES